MHLQQLQEVVTSSYEKLLLERLVKVNDVLGYRWYSGMEK
jgi:hypothetical protein